MNNPLDFDRKHVFVAGGTSGINLGIAECFAQAGAAVSVLSRSRDKVDAAVETLTGHGGKAAGYSADVRDYDAVAAALAQAHKSLGAIDVLVSGAAGNFVAPALGLSSNGFKAVTDIDLLGTFHVTRASHEHLAKPGASIINISAPQAILPYRLQLHVCAAKAGVDMVTRVLAMEWGPDGIRVNSIIPGPIDDTEGMARLAPTPEARQAVIESVPLGRYGSAADVGQLALFLASPLASYITGAVIPVDGGMTLAGSRSMNHAMDAAVAGE